MGRWICALLACLLLSVPQAHATGSDDAAVDAIFAAWDQPDTPGLALAVVRDGRIVYSRGYGMANLEYRVANTPATVFHAASLTKQFTAFAIQLLAQEGKLALDDEVRKYVPELQVQGPPITIRHLLHHTSGLRDQWHLLALAGLRLDDVITEGDILGLLWQQRQLNFGPGEEELYSNSGYSLLGLIVRRVSGLPLPVFAKGRIFGPLGMKDTHLQDNYGTLVRNRAYSYRKSGAGYSYVALSYSNVGATSLFTTVNDLALWDRNFTDAKVGGPDAVAAMLSAGKLNSGREINYASGLLKGRYRALPVVEHGGVDAGYRSHMLRLPEQRLSVLLLGNTAELNTGMLSRKVADVYLAGLEGVAPARALPPEVELRAGDLAPYLGEYEMRPGFILNFSAEGGQLMVQGTNQARYPMFASAPDSFFTKAFEAAVTFPKPGFAEPVTTALWKQGGRDYPLHRIARDRPAAETLQACAGDYYSEELRTLYTLSVQDGKLMVRHPRGSLELKPTSKDAFTAGSPLGLVTLHRNAAGACDGLAVTTGRVRNLQFMRVRLTPGG